MAGRLSLVGTPIGNLGDITLRAIERLKEVSRIYAEDTRRTRTLLSSLGIEGKRLLSLHAHSSARAIETAVEILAAGDDVALVTDAGMPGVSDPGFELVQAARSHGLVVDVIPGPSAVTASVALSGLVQNAFVFLGFLPRKGTKRKETLRRIAQSDIPSILFESPRRMNDALRDLALVCEPTRQIAICRELTKKFEETTVAALSDLTSDSAQREWQGEITFVVQAAPEGTMETHSDEFDFNSRAEKLLQSGASVKDATAMLVKELSRRGEKASRKDVYRRVLTLHDAQKD
jgi:16S rRNA (cytidine1402-2'-O)-methyltransferase